jgi:long-chain acyl-CoA synthetase
VRMRGVDTDDHEVPQGEVGEIVISGPNVMPGYWRRPEATAAAVRGGAIVYPRAIEEVLSEYPAVAEAAVLGLPHSSLGEEVGAAVASGRCQ